MSVPIGQLKQALKQADKAGNTEDAKKLADAIRRAQSREDERREGQGPSQAPQDLPEFGSLEQFGPTGEQSGTGARLGLAFATTPDEDARKDIIQKAIPGTEFTQDEEGNTVIRLPDGQEAYLNRPGLSMQDFADFSADVVKFLPAGKFAAGGKTLLRRMFRGGTAALTTSAAEDLAASAQGSEKGLQGGKAGATVAADVAAETAAAPLGLVGRVLKRTFGRRTGDIFTAAGDLTPRARKALGKAGIDPEKISPDLVTSAIRLSEEGTQPEGVRGVAQSQRFGLPLTRGQATGDFTQLAGEESLRGRADPAGDIMREFDRRQNERAIDITREIQEEYGGPGTSLARESEGGARIGEEVRRQAQELELAIDDAFEAARGTNATLNREGLDRLTDIPEVLRSQDDVLVDSNLAPATTKALDELGEISGEDVTAQTLERLDRYRRRLNQLQGAAANPTDRRGVTLLKKRFDQYLDDAFDNALFSGDQEALSLLKKARGLRSEYGERFQENTARLKSGRKKSDPGGKAVESIVENNATDEGVVNMLFGRANVFGSESAVKSIRALRKATGNSEEVNNTLKQLTFRRISNQAIDNGKFSPKKFVKAFDRMESENPAVAREIFTDSEWKSIKEFRDASERMIQPDRTINPSRTAETMQRMLGRLGMVTGLQAGGIGMGAFGGSVGRGAGGAIERSSSQSFARDAVNPKLLLPGRPNSGVIAGTIAAARQGGPTAIEEGAESLGGVGESSDQQERTEQPAQ